MHLHPFLVQLKRFPWGSAVLTLVQRFREDRLGLTASSLTFTTTIALVPFFTVALAVFTAFPIFGKLQDSVQAWLVQSLIPESIARQVLGYLTQFAGRASRLGALGLAALFITTAALVRTIDRTLNGIWHVRRPRPIGQRVLIYWAVMTLGPLLLGASLSISSYVISSSRGLVAAMPGTLQVALSVVEFFLLTAGLAALYRYVPNTPVERAHAWAGGLFSAVGIELARKLLALYIVNVPTYAMVYGTFATLPILLVWIYLVWVVVLLGAVLAAHMPSLVSGKPMRSGTYGWQFQIALEVLGQLHRTRVTSQSGLTMHQLVDTLAIDRLQLEPVLEILVALGWIGRLNELEDEHATRYLLLADPRVTALEPLMRHLLMPQSPATDKLWRTGQLSQVYLKDVL